MLLLCGELRHHELHDGEWLGHDGGQQLHGEVWRLHSGTHGEERRLHGGLRDGEQQLHDEEHDEELQHGPALHEQRDSP